MGVVGVKKGIRRNGGRNLLVVEKKKSYTTRE